MKNFFDVAKKIHSNKSSEVPFVDFSSSYFNGSELKNRTNNDYRYSRSSWIKPEYDFDEIAIAQDVEIYLSKSIQKKVNKIITAGFSFTGNDEEAVDWINRRVKEIAIAINKPFSILIAETFTDLIRFNNCMWVKARSEDFTEEAKGLEFGKTVKKPIAGYFILAFDRLEFQVNANGSLKKVLQKGRDRDVEFSAKDIIHFYTNRRPGYLVGSPELLGTLDDIRVLRKIEENVLDLIETSLFPVFHYQVGTDEMPERLTEGGISESQKVAERIKYIASSGFIVSDHRHKISAIGTEGKSLRIDYYLEHFKKRVLAGIGMSPVDLGEGGDANRSTASTMSKSVLSDIEGLTIIVKEFIEHFVIAELLEEGGFDSLDDDYKVEIRFGVIDKDDRRADENNVIQKFAGNVITMDEARKELKYEPFTDEHMERTHHRMFGEPLAMLGGLGPSTAASQALAKSPSSSIEPSMVKKEEQHAKMIEAKKIQAKKAAGSQRSSASKSRPSNQHGTRSSAKTNRDLDICGETFTITCNSDISADKLNQWKEIVEELYSSMDGKTSLENIINVTSWRLNG